MSWLTDAIKARDTETALDLIRGSSIKSLTYSEAFNLSHGNLLEAQENISSKFIRAAQYLKFYYESGQHGYARNDDGHLYGFTPLQLAAKLGLTDVVVALLAAGVPAEFEKTKVPPYNSTHVPAYLTSPLNLALAAGHDAAALFLIAAGANVNAYALTDLSYAGVPNEDVPGAYIKYAANSLYLAVAKCSLNTIKKLVERGAKVAHGIKEAYSNARFDQEEDSIGSTLIHAVAHRDDNSIDVIEFLLANGANPNQYIARACATSDTEWLYRVCHTALSLAVRDNKIAIAKILMRYGATLWPQIRWDWEKRLWQVDPDIVAKAEQIAAEINIILNIPGRPLPQPEPAPHHPDVQAPEPAPEPEPVQAQAEPNLATRSTWLVTRFILNVFARSPMVRKSMLDRVRKKLQNTSRGTSAATIIEKEYNKLLELDPALEVSVFEESLACPISKQLMFDPVIVVESQQTYERKHIEAWFQQSSIDPETGLFLSNKKFITNVAVKRLILSKIAQLTREAILKRDTLAAPEVRSDSVEVQPAIDGGIVRPVLHHREAIRAARARFLDRLESRDADPVPEQTLAARLTLT